MSASFTLVLFSLLTREFFSLILSSVLKFKFFGKNLTPGFSTLSRKNGKMEKNVRIDPLGTLNEE
jgi:hypothetical protein